IVGGADVRAAAAAASVIASADATAKAARRFTGFLLWGCSGAGGGASLARQLAFHPALERREQRLGGEQQPAALEHAARHAAVHRLDERRVLAPDLLVEREEL